MAVWRDLDVRMWYGTNPTVHFYPSVNYMMVELPSHLLSHSWIRIIGGIDMVCDDVLVTQRVEVHCEMSARVGSTTFFMPASGPAR